MFFIKTKNVYFNFFCCFKKNIYFNLNVFKNKIFSIKETASQTATTFYLYKNVTFFKFKIS